MPRPCAVETHARGYKERSAAFADRGAFADATALCRGDSRSRLQRKVSSVCGCHGLAPWRLTFAATKKGQQRLRMPRPCAVETHARGYKERSAAFADATALRRGDSRSRLQRKFSSVCGCHGLVPWSLTLAATKKGQQRLRMPRPCAVETHARGYKESSAAFADATALCRGASRSRLQRKVSSVCGCHGLVPWKLTLAVTKKGQQRLRMPRPCAVETHAR